MQTRTEKPTEELSHSCPSNTIVVDGRPIRVSKFLSLSLARSNLLQRTKPAWIVMGDHDDPWGAFWVCRPVDAERLQRAGYEITR